MAFELGPDVLGALGRDRQIQGYAQVAGSQGTAQVSERGKDLLVVGMIREFGRRPGRLYGSGVVVVPGEGDESLAARGQRCRVPSV